MNEGKNKTKRKQKEGTDLGGLLLEHQPVQIYIIIFLNALKLPTS